MRGFPDSILAESRFCITQGGAGSTSMARAAGAPVGVVPTHQEHRVPGDLIEAAGTGLCLDGPDIDDRLETVEYSALAEGAQVFAREPVDGARVVARRISEIAQ